MGVGKALLRSCLGFISLFILALQNSCRMPGWESLFLPRIKPSLFSLRSKSLRVWQFEMDSSWNLDDPSLS